MNSVRWNGKELYPSKIVCVGRNYTGHINELGNEVPQEAVIFLKPNSAISSEVHTSKHGVIHYEGEIAFLIISG